MTDFQKIGITFALEKGEIVIRIMLNWSLKWRLRKMKMIMMTTVMILAVVAIMIAQAVHVNNKIEKGLR